MERSPCHPEEAKPTKDLTMKKLITIIIAATFTLNSTGLPSAALAKPDALRPIATRTGVEDILYELSCLSQRPQSLDELDVFYKAHTNRGDIQKAEKELSDELSRAKSALINVAREAFSVLSETRTLETVSDVFMSRKTPIFEAMKELRSACIKMAILKKKTEYYYIYVRLDSPVCGICNEVSECLLKAANEAGLSAGWGEDKIVFPELVHVSGKVVHQYIGIKGDRGKIAVDLCSGVIIEKNMGNIAVCEIEEYREMVINALIEFYRAHPPGTEEMNLKYFRRMLLELSTKAKKRLAAEQAVIKSISSSA